MRRALRVDGMAWVMLSALLCVGAVVVTAMSAGHGAMLAAAPTAQALDWQAALGPREPWRLWTCAWVHGSVAHLGVNLAGGAVVAFVGWRARLPPASTAAWFVAWPGTQLLMAAIGSARLAAVMPHYFGLSGVLQAGVVVLGLSLAWPFARAQARLPASLARAGAGFAAAGASVTEPSGAAEAPMTVSGTRIESRVSTLVTRIDERPPRERWIGVAIVAGTLAKVAFEAPWELAPRASEALGIAVAPIAHACGVGAGALAWAAMRLLDRRVR